MKKFLTFFIFTHIYLSGQENNKAIEGVVLWLVYYSQKRCFTGGWDDGYERGLDITKDVDLLLKLQDGVLSSLVDQGYIRG